jgi:hypothetical protein
MIRNFDRILKNFDRILKQFGLSGGYRRVTLGRGVVGKSTSAFFGLCGVFGLVAVGLMVAHEAILLALAVLAALVYFFYQYMVIGYATNNPAGALLEGADLVKWHQHEIAAKGLKEIPQTPLVADPQNPIQLVRPPGE